MPVSAASRAFAAALAAAFITSGAGPGCGGSGPPAGHGPTGPNVLLVTLDTTRADRLGCYGYGGHTSPNLDAFAADGVLFERAFAQSALTPVSHASILTGLNPPRHGLRVIHAAEGTRLPASVPTLATVLAEAGWATAAFLSSFTVSEHFGLDAGFEVFDNGLAVPAEDVIGPTDRGVWMWNVRTNQRRSDETTDRALEWLERATGPGGAGRPFFLWVHYWDPHDPQMLPPKETLERFLGSGSERITGGEAPGSGGDLAGADGRAVYDAEISWVDEQFGRLVDALERAGSWDDTLVAVTADHGQGLGEHGWWHHRILYQEQIHLPLILRLPGGPRGLRIETPARSIDLFPTILEAAGVGPPAGSGRIDGESLAPLWSGGSPSRRVSYADALNLYDLNSNLVEKRPQDDVLHSVIDWPHKLIYRPLRPEDSELYDLEADPDESVNLYATEPDRAAALLEDLERLGGFVDGPFGSGATDPEMVERLRALGYLGGDG